MLKSSSKDPQWPAGISFSGVAISNRVWPVATAMVAGRFRNSRVRLFRHSAFGCYPRNGWPLLSDGTERLSTARWASRQQRRFRQSEVSCRPSRGVSPTGWRCWGQGAVRSGAVDSVTAPHTSCQSKVQLLGRSWRSARQHSRPSPCLIRHLSLSDPPYQPAAGCVPAADCGRCLVGKSDVSGRNCDVDSSE